MRSLLLTVATLVGSVVSSAEAADTAGAVELAAVRLDLGQSVTFRRWFLRIVHEQLRQGPTPRWLQRDCAGLVRFAAAQAFARHDAAWLRANGVSNRDLPPELTLTDAQRTLLTTWRQVDGMTRHSYVSAIGLIQDNSVFVSKDVHEAKPGDLLFYDQGDDQHLMVWTGARVAYHTGRNVPGDNGLRLVALDRLMHWKDTRWQPRQSNPDFIGIFRFSFLSD